MKISKTRTVGGKFISQPTFFLADSKIPGKFPWDETVLLAGRNVFLFKGERREWDLFVSAGKMGHLRLEQYRG